MGLDSVELVMALEEEFGTEIPDAAAERMRTPRDVIDFFAAKVYWDPHRCTSRAGFYQFRRTCISALGLKREQVRPDTKLIALLPPEGIRLTWQQLGEAMSVRYICWPDLEFVKWVDGLRFIVCLLVVAVCTITAGSMDVLFGYLAFFLSFLLAAMADMLLTERLEPYRIVLPKKVITVGDLIHKIVPRDWVKAQGAIHQWDRERVAKRVKEIVIAELGIDEKIYHEDAKFIEDFGID